MRNSPDSHGKTTHVENDLSGIDHLVFDNPNDSQRKTRAVQAPTGLDALPTDEFLKIVGLRVRARRSTLSMSRKRLAEVSGVSERYLAQLESGQGNMSIALLRKVTTAIGISLASLLSAQVQNDNQETAHDTQESAPENVLRHVAQQPYADSHNEALAGESAAAHPNGSISQSNENRLVPEV